MAIYSIFKIIVLDKVYLGGSYDYTQLKSKFFKTKYYENIRIYNKLNQYIRENDIYKTDIHFELIYKKYFNKRCIKLHRLILEEFIQIYDSIETGLNMAPAELEPENKIIIFKPKKLPMTKCDRSKLYYQRYRAKILLKNKEKRLCKICECYIVHSQVTRHRTTNKHTLNLTINQLKATQVL